MEIRSWKKTHETGTQKKWQMYSRLGWGWRVTFLGGWWWEKLTSDLCFERITLVAL